MTQTPGQRTASTVLDLIDGTIDTAAEKLVVRMRQGSFIPVSPACRHFDDAPPATWTVCWKHAMEARRAWLDRRARIGRMHTAYGRRRR